MQKCIHGKRLSFLRLVYDPIKHISKGHYVDSILRVFDQLKEVDDKLTAYFKLTNTFESLKFVESKDSTDFGQEAKKVYDFFLYILGLRLSKLTLDFMKDFNGRIWLINLKSYELEYGCYRIKQLEFFEIKDYNGRRRDYKETSNS